jgi:hypothetical protein
MDPRLVTRHLLLACGWIALALGVVGLFLPVLPTAPFVLLAAACFARSSERLHDWLIEHPVFGAHIESYLAGKGLHRRTKAIALATLWVSVGVSALLLVPFLIVDLALVLIATAVTVYLLRLPTCESPGGAQA